jgi:hypothetical protein
MITMIQCCQNDNPVEPDCPSRNTWLLSFSEVLARLACFKDRSRAFYFEVMLSPYRCPECEGPLRMTDTSRCSCACGNTFDPTLEFQKSACCGARLVRRTQHYACSRCHEVIPSHFLFDERLFDREYFREMMQEHRRKARQEREEMKRFLAESRSSTLLLTEAPHLESLDGFLQDLDTFIQGNPFNSCDSGFEPKSTFSMDRYRSHILSCLSRESMRFSDIAQVDENMRRDKAWRFITLVFMQNDRVIDLIQEGDNIWVQRLRNEAHA